MSDDWVVMMPKLGETVTEGEITTWFKAAGDEVAFDDPLFEVSTDKVDSEIPSPYDGVLLEVLSGRGDGSGGDPAGADRPARVGARTRRRSTPGGRTPRRARATAAAGGPSLGNRAAPQVGG